MRLSSSLFTEPSFLGRYGQGSMGRRQQRKEGSLLGTALAADDRQLGSAGGGGQRRRGFAAALQAFLRTDGGVEHPGVLGASALAGVHLELSLRQHHPRQA